MLYISRFFSPSKFGVVDTDDGSETVSVWADVEEAIKHGVDIKGVDVGYAFDKRGRKVPFVEHIGVYQDIGYLTRQQIKLNVLAGIDVKVFGSQIVSLNWDVSKTSPSVRLRLSDYGTSCSGMIFRHQSYSSMPTLTVVLDDKIEVTNKTFRDFIHSGATIDLSEVRVKKTAEYVYRELVHANDVLNVFHGLVIDGNARADFYKGLVVLNRYANRNPSILDIRGVVTDPDRVSQEVGKKYRREFEIVSKAQYSLHIEDFRRNDFCMDFIDWVETAEPQRLLNHGSYMVLRQGRFLDVFRAMWEVSMCSRASLVRFKNYVMFFGATPEIQESYVRFCRRACAWLSERANAIFGGQSDAVHK